MIIPPFTSTTTLRSVDYWFASVCPYCTLKIHDVRHYPLAFVVLCILGEYGGANCCAGVNEILLHQRLELLK